MLIPKTKHYKAENTKEIVLKLFKDHLKLNLVDTDISIAHRLQPPRRTDASSQPPHDRRNIIIRFCRKDLIGTVFKHCKNMTPPFYVNESLTPVRTSISYALRALKKITMFLRRSDRSRVCRKLLLILLTPPPPPVPLVQELKRVRKNTMK